MIGKRYYEVIRKYHPDAVISVCGPDVRWIGNEGGRVRKSEWSVIPAYSQANEKVAENSQQNENEGKKLAEVGERDEDLGSREILSKYKDLCFKPAEADVSINLGWFWHNNFYYLFKKNRTAEDLAQIYFNSVGGNASMLLNVPPDKKGLINKREIATLEKFTRLITEPFRNELTNLSFSAFKINGKKRKKENLAFGDDEMGVCVSLGGKREVTALKIKEDLRFSQRIEEFELYAKTEKGYGLIYKGTVIGSGKIIRLEDRALTDELLLIVTQSRSNPVLKDIRVYLSP